MIALGSLEKRGNISEISSALPCRRRPRGNYMTKCSSCTLIGSTEVRFGVRCSPKKLQSDKDSVARQRFNALAEQPRVGRFIPGPAFGEVELARSRSVTVAQARRERLRLRPAHG